MRVKKIPFLGRHGMTLIEVVLYVALLGGISVLAVNSILTVTSAFGKSRVERKINEQGVAALERIIREIRLAYDVDTTSTTFNIHPGRLSLFTTISPTDTATTIRKFFLQGTTMLLQEGTAPAVALTPEVKITNLVFRLIRAPTVYYVRGSFAGCADSATGTSPATAFCTLSRAASGVVAGDVVYVGASTYTESVRPVSSGTNGNPIIFIGDSGGVKTGDAGQVVVRGVASPAFDLSQRSFITIIGFRIQDSTGGIFFSNDATTPCTNIIIENNTFTNVSGDSTHLAAIDNSDATDQTTNKDHIIRYNLIYNNTARAIALDRGSNILVEHNIIYSNGTDNVQIVAAKGTIRNNVIYKANTPREGIDISGRNGITTDLDITNNTFYFNRQGVEITGGSGSIVVDIIDNIFKDNTQNGILVSNTSNVTCRYSYNMFHNDVASGCTDNGNNITADPRLVDPDGANNILGGTGGADDKFQLSQIAAGQAVDSLAVNGGSQSAILANLDTFTTRTDNVLDGGVVDLGYHYTVTPYINPSFSGGSATSKTIRIEMTLEAGDGRLRSSQKFYGNAILRGSY